MAKVKMVCPISRGMCVDCAVYRGRHYYLCFSKEYQGSLVGPEQINIMKSKSKSVNDEKFGMPDDIPRSSKWINNVEELIERRGL